ncbi:MAG: winged helix-turn-helix domain-containing protein [Desulfobacterales bacterium]
MKHKKGPPNKNTGIQGGVCLEYMRRNEGQILTKTMILDRVWGYDFDTQSNII